MTITLPPNVPETEFSEKFAQGMADRMAVSFCKYGAVKEAYPHRVDAIASLKARLERYERDGNTEWLMDVAAKIVAELGLDHFFNIQLVGGRVIEVNPRISTVVYQEDLNLPWLGVRHALGEISEEELGALASRIRPTRRALRYFDQVEWDE